MPRGLNPVRGMNFRDERTHAVAANFMINLAHICQPFQEAHGPVQHEYRINKLKVVLRAFAGICVKRVMLTQDLGAVS
jgi:hypothetical protein